MDSWTIFLSAIAATLGVCYYFFRDMYFFEGTRIPYIRPAPILGNMWPAILRRSSMADVVKEIYNLNREAKYVGFFDMMNPILIIRDPELIKMVAVKNFDHFVNHRAFVDQDQDPLFGKNLFGLQDEQWRDVRTLLSPAFTTSKMKNMFTLMHTCGSAFADFIAKLPAESRIMEMKEVFARYTIDVIATCAFGISVDSMKNPKNDFYVMGRDVANFSGLRTVKLFALRSFPKIAKLLNVKFINDKQGGFFKDIIETTIRTRDEKGITRSDMIQLMMDTRGKRGANKELTLEDMTSQAFIFFFGGFDGTSTVMSFAAHEIAANPEVHKRLQNEIDELLKKKGEDVTYEDLNTLEYLDGVIYETLRMWPIAVFADRVCSKSFELPPALPGCKPFVVRKGMNVWFPVYGLHRDPDYFEEPDKFKPERFVGENKKNINNSAYMPFGLGPRMCIANRFALLETKVMIFHILAKCNLKPCAKTCIPMELAKTGLSMLAKDGFWLDVQPRTKATLANGTVAT